MKKSIFVSICLLLAIPCYAKIIYVDVNTPNNNNGSDWDNAYKYLQDALENAVSGDEIWVAQGTYKPAKDLGDPDARYKSFCMKNGVAIYGGFPNTGKADFDDRDPNTYKSILSGDLNGDDGPNFVNNTENSYHVFYHPEGTNLDSTAVLDGFTITAGNADGPPSFYSSGSGMYNYQDSPTVINCTFTNNLAGLRGGGICNLQSSPTVINCTFIGNSVSGMAFVSGGGMFNYQGNSTIINCTFTDNSASGRHRGSGGGIYSFLSEPNVVNCTFNNNSASQDGGGMYLAGKPNVINCIFSGNSAEYNGGAICCSSDVNIANCTFTDNSANQDGGAICSYSSHIYPYVYITNCTFSGNLASRDGGAIFNYETESDIINCSFSNNSANQDGGGIYNDGVFLKNVINCTFSGNSASRDGGGMFNFYCWGDSYIRNCTFVGNLASRAGGGMGNDLSSLTITNSIFTGNSANYGGGTYQWLSHLIVKNCRFTGNSAESAGGGILTDDFANITNCTFSNNSSSEGGGIYNYYTNGNITNCILWDNTATTSGPQIYNLSNYYKPTVSYSDVEGGWDGTSNIDQDPCFVDADGADNIIGTEDENLRLLADSPCIDAGDPNYIAEPNETDLDGNPRIFNEIVDMGAYEFQDPVGLILDMIDYINDLNLHKGTTNSLLTKLDNALKLLEDENENNDSAAINLLEAFINDVEAQYGKKIPEADAEALIVAAEQIIELLSTD